MINILPPKIETSKVVNASSSVLWRILTDTTQWVNWGPSIREVECSERLIQQGTKGRIKTALGFWLPFEVTDFVSGRYWSWRVSGIPATGHRIDPLAEKMCRLAFEMPFFAMPYLGICVIALRRIASIAERY